MPAYKYIGLPGSAGMPDKMISHAVTMVSNVHYSSQTATIVAL